MKDFRGFICQPTETVKKGRRSKHCTSKNDSCKCFAEPVNLHYCHCPFARKSCPIHGKSHHHCVKDEENVIISFHPTSKTDKFFKPVKELLAHCDPDTKINLEYYSPTHSKDGIRHRQVQTNSENFNKSSGNSIFAEKSRSFVADKANKMKKLKQCFKSPCDSVVTKAKSQTSLREKLNEHLREYLTNGTNTLEDLLGDAYYERFKWTSSNKLDSSDWENSSDDKMKSDFLTVTKQKQNNIIDHKILEIKHKKDFYNFPFAEPPKQSPFVYPSRITKRFEVSDKKTDSLKVSPKYQSPPQADYSSSPHSINPSKTVQRYERDKIPSKKLSHEDTHSISGKSHSTSSGSAYFSPFILIPSGMKNIPKEKLPHHDAQVQSGGPGYFEKFTQTDQSEVAAPPIQKEATDLGSSSPDVEVIYSPSETSTLKKYIDRSTSMVLEKLNHWSLDEESKQMHIYDAKKVSLNIESKMVFNGNNNSDSKNTQTNQADTRDKQTETVKAKKNKMLMTIPNPVKSVQTSLSFSSSGNQSHEGEFLDLDSNATFVVLSHGNTNSTHAVDPSYWLRSRSDGELYFRKDKDPTDDGISSLHHVCLCDSDSSNSEIDTKPVAKIERRQQQDLENNNTNPLNEKEAKLKQEHKTGVSKKERTSLSDLSELVKTVNHIFDKMSKTCKCEKAKEKVFPGIPSANSSNLKFVEAEAQTSFRVILDLSPEDKFNENPSKVKIRRSVLQTDDVQTIFLCKICFQEVKTCVMDSGTITDIMATSLYTEKEVASVNTSTDSLENTLPLDKKAVNVTVCKSKPFEISPRDDLVQVDETIVKDWALKLTPMQCPAYVNGHSSEESKNVANTPDEKKEPTVEKNNIKKENIPVAQEAQKPPSAPKPKPQTPGKFKSNIPSPTAKKTNFKDRESILKTDTPSRPMGKSTKNHLNKCPIQLEQCICEDQDASTNKPPKPPKRPSKCLQNTSTQNTSAKPQISAQPGRSGSKPDRTNPSTRTHKVPSHQSKIFYPVIIKPLWYENFSKTLQIIKDHDFGLKQRRSSSGEEDFPGRKKVKEREDGSGECFGLEENFLPWSGKEPIDIRTGTGFVWIPSSAFQLPKAEGLHSPNPAKVTKSETKVLKCSNLFKGSNKEATPAKSCRLKPVQKENFQKEQSSSEESEHEAAETKDENATHDYYNHDPSNFDNLSQTRDEYAPESLFDSDRSDFCEGTENDDLEEEEECDENHDDDDDDDDYKRVEGCPV